MAPELTSDDTKAFGEDFTAWTRSPENRWRCIDRQSWDDHDVAYVMRRIRLPPQNRLLSWTADERGALDAGADEHGIATNAKRQHVLNRFIKDTPVFLGASLAERGRNALLIAMPPRDANMRLMLQSWKWYEVVPASKRERVVNAVFTDLRSGGFRATDSLWTLIRAHLIGISRSFVDAIIKKHELRQIQNLPPAVVNPIRSQWPNERWQIDMFVLRDTRTRDRRFFYVAVVIDHFSKYVWTKWVKKPRAMVDEQQRFERHKYIFDWIATDLEMNEETVAGGRAVFGPDKVNASVIDGNPNTQDYLRVPGAHGRPNILQGDNEFSPKNSKHTVNWCLGSNVDNAKRDQMTRDLSKYHGPRVQLVNSLPYQPKTNGLVERVNGTLKRMLRSWLYTTDTGIIITQDIFERALCDITRTYNSTKHSTTGFTPFEVYFGQPDAKIADNFHRRVRTFDNDEVTEIATVARSRPGDPTPGEPDPGGAVPELRLGEANDRMLTALGNLNPDDDTLLTVHNLYAALAREYRRLYNTSLPDQGTDASLDVITRLRMLVQRSPLRNRQDWQNVWPVAAAGAVAANLTGGERVELRCPQNRREVWHNQLGDPHSQPSAENAIKRASPGCSVFNWKFNPADPNLHREICNHARWGINFGAEKMLKHTEVKLKKQQTGAGALEVEVGTVVRLLKSKSERIERRGSSVSTEGKNWRKAHKGDGTIKSEELLDELERRAKTTFYWTRELYVVIEVLKDTRDAAEQENDVQTKNRLDQKKASPVGNERAARQTLVRHADMRAPAGRQGRQLTVYDHRTPLAVGLATRYRLAPLDETADFSRPPNLPRYVHVSQKCIQSKRSVREMQQEYNDAIDRNESRDRVNQARARLDNAKKEARKFNNYTSTMESLEVRHFNDGAVSGSALDDLIASYTTTPLKWCFYRTEIWPMWPTKAKTLIPGYDAEIDLVRTFRFKNDQRSRGNNLMTATEMEQQNILEKIRLAKEKAGKQYPILIRESRRQVDKAAAIDLFKKTLLNLFANQTVYKNSDPAPHTIYDISFRSVGADAINDIQRDNVLFVLRSSNKTVPGLWDRTQISFIEPVTNTREAEASFASPPAAG